MCQITDANPVEVRGMGLRLSHEINDDMYNYGHFQILFADGSLGWYEAGWGPMMSETAYFVKDVIGPKGCVSIVDKVAEESSDIDSHTQTGCLKVHHATRDANGQFLKKDTLVDTSDEPDHDGLCFLEQQYLLKAIKEDIDLSDHARDAVNSLRIVLAADESFKTGKTVDL